MEKEKRNNEQCNTKLNQFQKLVLQNIYIKKLNLWLDELNWENEKKERIIEMKDEEIELLKEKCRELDKELEETKKRIDRIGGKNLLVRKRVFPR